MNHCLAIFCDEKTVAISYRYGILSLTDFLWFLIHTYLYSWIYRSGFFYQIVTNKSAILLNDSPIAKNSTPRNEFGFYLFRFQQIKCFFFQTYYHKRDVFKTSLSSHFPNSATKPHGHYSKYGRTLLSTRSRFILLIIILFFKYIGWKNLICVCMYSKCVNLWITFIHCPIRYFIIYINLCIKKCQLT